MRNAIVHQRTDGHAIAEPYVDVVRDIERIRDRLVRPPGLLPLAAQPVVTCEASDHIGSAAMQMRRGNFSQLPVYEDARFLQLLTAETITRWMAFTLRDNDGLLEEVPVAEVLPHAETTDNVAFLSRGATAFDALGAFEEFFQRGQFLNAILLTEAGSTAQASARHRGGGRHSQDPGVDAVARSDAGNEARIAALRLRPVSCAGRDSTQSRDNDSLCAGTPGCWR